MELHFQVLLGISSFSQNVLHDKTEYHCL